MNRTPLTLAAALTAALFAAPVFASDYADNAKIIQAISGKTVQGSMISSGVYTEFYGADGEIRGDGYQGAWSVKDNQMCFQYADDPASCWDVQLDGPAVTWVQNGKELGTGTIVDGNINDF